MKAKIGFIGAGARACCYAVRLKDLKEVEVEYTAICDINPEFGSAFNQFYADGKAALYTDYREMLRRHPDLDAVVICVPTDMHEETAVACLSADIHVLLEKPLAKTPQSCFNILTAARNHTKSATLGFVLRYTPFYGKCRELVNSGLCGDILTVNAEDIVGLRVTRFMTSGWRRKQAWSGGSLLEKCCHDLDILNWIMGKLPVRVQSFGSLRAFHKKADAGPRCRDCRIADDCPYFIGTQGAHESGAVVTWSDECLYDGEVDICDRQVMALEYDDGAVVSLTMTLGSDISTRTIRIIGTKGRVEGDIAAGEVRVGSVMPLKQETYRMVDDRTGHHGGDGMICKSFERSLLDPDYKPTATVEDGFHAAMVAFAGERSRIERRPVELAELYAELGLKAGEAYLAADDE